MMLIVALIVLAVSGGLFLAGFAVGCAVTNANRDDDVHQAREYERERLEHQWEAVTREAALARRWFRQALRLERSQTPSTPTPSTTTRTLP